MSWFCKDCHEEMTPYRDNWEPELTSRAPWRVKVRRWFHKKCLQVEHKGEAEWIDCEYPIKTFEGTRDEPHT